MQLFSQADLKDLPSWYPRALTALMALIVLALSLAAAI